MQNTQHNEDQRIAIDQIGNLTEGVSIVMMPAINRTYFRDIVNLRNTPEYDIEIKTIVCFGVTVMATDPENRPVSTEACIRGSALTLCIGETQMKQAEPLINLATQYQNGVLKEQFGLLNVNWEKSYVETRDPALFTTDGVFYFEIGYFRRYKN